MDKNKFSILFIILGIIAILISSIVLSGNKLFWMDELITYYLVSDNSLLHMVHAIADQVDSSPPFYYIVLHFWALIFGSSELPLRLFSSLMMAGSFFVLFNIFKKIFGLYEAVIGSTVIFFINSLILNLNSEARCYGLFIFEFSVLLFLYLEIIFNNKKYFVILSIVQAFFILTHPFGILYSFALLFSTLLYFFITRTNYRLIISSLTGFLLSIVYLPVFLNQIKVGDHNFWISKPTIANGLGAIIEELIICPKWITLIISLIGLLCFIHITWRIILATIKNNSPEKYNEKTFLYILCYALILIPVAVFIYSNLFTSIFVKRYMILSDIVWGLILITILDNYKTFLVKKLRLIKYKNIIQFIAILVVLIPIVTSFSYKDPNGDEIFEDLKETTSNKSLVLLSPHKYLPRYYYSNNKSSILLVIDEKLALLPNNVRNAYPDFELMKALKRNYPLHNIVFTSDLMDSLKIFRVRNEKNQLWFNQKVFINSNYYFSEIYKNVFEVKRKDYMTQTSN